MRDRRMIMVLAAVAAGALLLALLGPLLTGRDRQPEQPARQQTSGVTAKGMVESSEEVTLSSQVKGVVQRVAVSAGDTVTKGQLLLEFDRRKVDAQLQQARAAVAAAEARLAEVTTGFRTEDVAVAQHGRQRAEAVHREARDEFERLRRLQAHDAATLVEVNRAEERLRVAEAQLREADATQRKYRSGSRSEEVRLARAEHARAVADLRYSESVAADYRVTAPIAGVVAERHKDPGESADTDTPLFRLVNPALTRIRAELEETEVGKVRAGQQAEVTADAYPGKTFAGQVTKVFPVVQRKSMKSFDPMATIDINTQEIHVALKDASAFKNGMTVTVRFK